MGTIALYTLLYCILHIPLGTAMSYNLTSALFIAIFLFSFSRISWQDGFVRCVAWFLRDVAYL